MNWFSGFAGMGRQKKSPETGALIKEDEMTIQEVTTLGNGSARPGQKYLESKTEFRKQLGWLIKNPPEGSIQMTITPAMAEEMLVYNTDNRPLSAATVKKYKGEIERGRWMQTGVPIIFSTTARLLDGQNRLNACVEAGKSFVNDVRFGITDEAFAFIDRGKTRTAADIFAIHGVPNYTQIASATRWVWQYDNNLMTGISSGWGYLNPDELYEFYLLHQKMQAGIPICNAFTKSGLLPPSLALFLHYVCARKSCQQADEFYLDVALGVDRRRSASPEYKLHQLLVKNAANERKLHRIALSAVCINAWNAMRLGRKSFDTGFAVGVRFPKAA